MINPNKYLVVSSESGGIVEDAVVIRTGDLFAGPALHAYVGAIQTAIEMLALVGGQTLYTIDAAHLSELSDYFHSKAVEADERSKKLPS